MLLLGPHLERLVIEVDTTLLHRLRLLFVRSQRDAEACEVAQDYDTCDDGGQPADTALKLSSPLKLVCTG